MSLESNGAIEVPLILRGENGTVYLSVQIPHEVFLADVAHLVWKKNGTNERELIDSIYSHERVSINRGISNFLNVLM
jgi:hypothetical protein